MPPFVAPLRGVLKECRYLASTISPPEVSIRVRLAAACVGVIFLLGGCGGVDREGTKAELLKGLGDTVPEDQKQCMADSIDKFSDDELKKANTDQSSPEMAKVIAEMTKCITG